MCVGGGVRKRKERQFFISADRSRLRCCLLFLLAIQLQINCSKKQCGKLDLASPHATRRGVHANTHLSTPSLLSTVPLHTAQPSQRSAAEQLLNRNRGVSPYYVLVSRKKDEDKKL